MFRLIIVLTAILFTPAVFSSHVNYQQEVTVAPTVSSSITSLYVKENTVDMTAGGCIWLFGDPQVPNHCVQTYELLPDTFFTQDKGGHNHDDSSKPLGKVKINGVDTNKYEYFSYSDSGHTITYIASPFSGDVVLRTTVCTNEGFFNPCFHEYRLIHVRDGGLSPLPSSTNYTLIGSTTTHPSNHYANASMKTFISSLSTKWVNNLNNAVLQINDISLKYGGHFDVGGNWTNPHKQHIFGNDVDIHYVGAANEVEFTELVAETGNVRYQTVHNNHHHISLHR